ncbi:MAG TPA: DUF2460 domain-containing protein [Rhizomicrobium sp.]|jgi:hypothetical protein|nr:DUF2460 domain-containing protein [Rhizomicrobium sp.]
MFTYPRHLPGLAYSKVRRPKHNVSVQTHQSGGEVRMSYWSEPLWEWDLTYDLLRHGVRNGRAWDELLQIEGLFLASTGNLSGFQFHDDDDHRVTRTLVGSSDGTTTTFTLKRYRGSWAGGPLGLEAIGVLDFSEPFNLYLNTLPGAIDPNDPVYGYTLDTTKPKNQQLVFNSAPPPGHTFVCDMSYFFYVRFQTDSLDLEKFMHQLWSLKKVTLCSLRF